MALRQGDADLLRRALLLIGLGALVLLLWQIQDVLLLVFASVLVAIILRLIAAPIGRFLHLSEGWALTLAALLLAGFLGVTFYLFGSEVVGQGKELARILPEAWNAFKTRFGLEAFGQEVAEQANNPQSALLFNVAGWVFSAGAIVVNLVLVIVGGLYIAAAPELYRKGLLLLFPEKRRPLAEDTLDTAGNALRLWLIGQLGAMVLVGTLTAIGLLIIGIPAPLALGLLAGLAEFVPLVGPIAAAVPALLLAMGGGIETMLWTAALYLLVQQVESNVITPLIQHRTVDIPPALTLFAVIAAGVAFGAVGIVLAAPLAVLAFVAVKKLYVRETLGETTKVPGEKPSGRGKPRIGARRVRA
ncbi:AI-2E family transporter [Terrihabitans soli]|uniref:AI-2E family transporter n=1 Tax=Terrihabitans soli TaxID=708113 RepID=A0A6S6QRE1_9HYPH|nr:AI-2E family transporter [Terrihabitans soli]BCJ90305.1 AI-2E family transporter [Terrihabitans soli]